jgi:hypothetical protein
MVAAPAAVTIVTYCSRSINSVLNGFATFSYPNPPPFSKLAKTR